MDVLAATVVVVVVDVVVVVSGTAERHPMVSALVSKTRATGRAVVVGAAQE